MSAIAVAMAEAIRHVREVALRDVMAMVSRLQPNGAVDWSGSIAATDQEASAYRVGHRHCQLNVVFEIERMIATETPTPTAADRDDDGDGC